MTGQEVLDSYFSQKQYEEYELDGIKKWRTCETWKPLYQVIDEALFEERLKVVNKLRDPIIEKYPFTGELRLQDILLEKKIIPLLLVKILRPTGI